MYPIGTTLKWQSINSCECEEYREAQVTVAGVVQFDTSKIYGVGVKHGSDCSCIVCWTKRDGAKLEGRDKKVMFKDFISWVKSLPPGKVTIVQELDV